jgi:2-iminoacetate synthase
MNFYEYKKQFNSFNFKKYFASVTDSKIQKILSKNSITLLDYLALLSPAAQKHIEQMAQCARALTIKHFGKSILMYAPIYLSNYCQNQCAYCGFCASNKISRKQLTLGEVAAEAKLLAAFGIKHVLILTGDNSKIATVDYILSCARELKKYFSSIAAEVYALTENEYKLLAREGIDLLTMYQETYDEKLYKKLHVFGPKKDYFFRLTAPERALRALLRGVNIGALLGLKKEFYEDAFFTAAHAEYLQNKYIHAEVSVSFPRMCESGGTFKSFPVSDINLVQMITAFRIFMPRAGITLSTRESAAFRDNLLPLGITKMSAGSQTAVGGYSDKGANQFEMSDVRSVAEIRKMLLKRGFQPVFKNWDIL